MKTHHFWGNTWGKLELVLRRLEFLGLYSYLKVHFENGRRSSSFQGSLDDKSIKRLAKLRIISYISVILLLFLTIDTIIPIYIKHTPVEAESGIAKKSTLTYNATNTTASVKLNVTSKDGTFATSDDNEKIKFTLSTNNATGYTLSIRAASNMDKVTLSNGSDGVIEPLPEDPSGNGVSATTYASSGSAGQAYNNTWGYIPNYYHSSNNTNTYYRAPNTTTGEVLRETITANSSNGIDNADSYSIGLGIRANYAKASGTYTSDNVLVLEYVANPVAYSISYADNTGDTISGMPSNTGSQSTSATTIKLSSTIPTRTGYTFSKWCLGTVSNNGTTCTGTLFDAGGDFGIDQTISPNSATLYAVWTIKTYTVTIVRNNDDYGATSPTSLSLPYGTTLPTTGTTSTSITLGNTTVTATPTTQTSQYVYSFTNWTHSCGAAIANDCTITANFTGSARSYTITINSNNTNYGTVSPTGLSKTYGTSIPASGSTDASITIGGSTITATPKSGYKLSNWTHSCGATLTGACTITANFETVTTFDQAFANAGKSKQSGYYKMQDMTASICSAVTTGTSNDGSDTQVAQLVDTRDSKVYWVAKLKTAADGSTGECWMTQNLDFNISTTNVKAADSDVTSDWTTSSTYKPVATLTNVSSYTSSTNTVVQSWDAGDWYYNGTSSTSCGSKKTTYSGCTGFSNTGDAHRHVGNMYSWNAATAGTGGTITSGQAAGSICPKGWRLPTGGSSGEFKALQTAGSLGSTVQNWLNAPYYFTRTGRLWYDSDKLSNAGNGGYYWSSTPYSASSYAYSLYFYGSSNVFPAGGDGGRALGMSVRCVAR